MKLLKNRQSISTKKYYFLNEISKYSGKKVISECFFEMNLCLELEQEIEQFFKTKGLPESLQKHFGIKSPLFVKQVYATLIKETEKNIIVNTNYYLIFDVLSKLFLDQQKPNYSLFLQAIQKREIMAQAIIMFDQRIRVAGFFRENFTDTQIFELLCCPLNLIALTDTFAMFFQNDIYFKEHLSKISFNQKNTIQKIHDIFSREMKKIQSQDFLLNQELQTPILIDLQSELIDSNIKFVCPNNYHSLIEWGQDLGHCIGSKDYSIKALTGKSILLGVFINNELKYTLEIGNQTLIQIQGKSGTRPDDLLLDKIKNRLRKYRLIK